MQYSLGLDYGTNSVRALIVSVADGEEIASSVWDYRHGERGVVLDDKDPNLARQHPRDYEDGAEAVIRDVLKSAAGGSFSPRQVIGIGIDTTGSTPLPVDGTGMPLAYHDEFADDPAAYAWLWKDHSSHQEAQEITDFARRHRPEYLAKCGGTYSSEWFWAKILRCLRTAPEVFRAAQSWVELADWLPAILTGTADPAIVKRGICAAGHKAMFHPSWGGYPDGDFLALLAPELAGLRRRLPTASYSVRDRAGTLTREWADRTGLPEGIPVAVGAFDAHFGGIGSGIRPGVLVKNMGTSSCDMMVVPLSENLADIPGVAGVVPESILPGYHGIEAGQSAVGDIFNWFVEQIQPGGPEAGSHADLTRAALEIPPGSSGLLALDWHNGNRTILVDQRLTGMIMGMTLRTGPAEIYRALVEATAFGSRVIVERLEEYGLSVEEIVNCGGISVKNGMIMQIYADVLNRPMKVSRSPQTAALGAAMAGAVVAYDSAVPEAQRVGHPDFETAVSAMTGTLDTIFRPNPEAARVYERLYGLYREVHDAFGVKGSAADHFHVMKDLLALRDEVRGAV